MKTRYKTEEEIAEVVRTFEDASIARGLWKHAEHLTVALHYLSLYDLETATKKMRDGIFNLLTDGFKVDLEKEMPYHETLTVFWMKTVAEFNATRNGSSLLKKANDLVATYDKDHPLKFYSREFLFCDAARASWAEPDLVDAPSPLIGTASAANDQ